MFEFTFNPLLSKLGSVCIQLKMRCFYWLKTKFSRHFLTVESRWRIFHCNCLFQQSKATFACFQFVSFLFLFVYLPFFNCFCFACLCLYNRMVFSTDRFCVSVSVWFSTFVEGVALDHSTIVLLFLESVLSHVEPKCFIGISVVYTKPFTCVSFPMLGRFRRDLH